MENRISRVQMARESKMSYNKIGPIINRLIKDNRIKENENTRNPNLFSRKLKKEIDMRNKEGIIHDCREEMSKYDLAKKLIDENNEFGDRHDSPALRQGADIAKGLGVLGKNTALAFLPGGIGVAGAAAYGEDYTQGVLNNSVNPYVEGIISGGISVGTDAFMDAIAPSVVEVFDTNCKKIFGKSFEKLTTQQKEYVVKIFAPTIYEWKTMQ